LACIASGVSFADQFLIGEGAIDFSGVKEGDAAVHRLAEERNHGVPILDRAVVRAHAHAAEAQGGNLKAGAPQFAGLHVVRLSMKQALRPVAARLAIGEFQDGLGQSCPLHLDL
jgi:hypothetical protein